MAKTKTKKGQSNKRIKWIVAGFIIPIFLAVILYVEYIEGLIVNVRSDCMSVETCRYGIVNKFQIGALFMVAAILITSIIFVILLVSALDDKAIKKSNRNYERILDGIANGVAKLKMKDGNLKIDYANEGFYNMQGYTRKEYKEKFKGNPFALLSERDFAIAMEAFNKLEPGNTIAIEYHINTISNNKRWILVNIERNIKRQDTYMCTFTDVSKHKRTEDELSIANRRMDYVLGKINSTIVEYDIEKDEFIYITTKQKEYPFKKLKDLLTYGLVDEESYNGISRMIEKSMNRRVNQNAHMAFTYDGVTKWYEVRFTTVFDSSDVPTRILVTILDVDKNIQEKTKLISMASCEPLTGLLNRASAEAKIKESMNEDEFESALIMLDIDSFKHINDTYGHAIGDEVICYVANELKSLFRDNDVVCRSGGDEYIVYMRNVKDLNFIAKRCEQICEAFSHYQFPSSSEQITCSIGVAIYPRDGENYVKLSKHADEAMYYQKNNGKNGATFYHDIIGLVEIESEK